MHTRETHKNTQDGCCQEPCALRLPAMGRQQGAQSRRNARNNHAPTQVRRETSRWRAKRHATHWPVWQARCRFVLGCRSGNGALRT